MFCFVMLRTLCRDFLFFFFFNDTATTEIYTLSLHDALPISHVIWLMKPSWNPSSLLRNMRSEEHTSELQSPDHLVCRLLLEKKKREILKERMRKESGVGAGKLFPSGR